MIAPIAGGSMPLGIWFTWHQILMTLAFPCLMVIGKWVYVADGLGEKRDRRSVHRILMMAAWACTLVGYLAVLMDHLPERQFFGYDFALHAWKSPGVLVHTYIGYVAVLLVLFQAPMGLVKMDFLRSGVKIFTFHGRLGNMIIPLGALNIVVACCWWGWPTWMAMALGVSSSAAVVLVLYPRNVQSEEK